MDNEGAEGKTAAGDMEWRQQMEARLKALEATQLDVAGETSTFHENPLLAAVESGAQMALGTDQALQASSATTLTEAIIMRTVAGMQGHPTNVHQVTAALLKSHGKEAKITRFAVGSFFLVLMQTAVCFSVLTTSQWPSCVTSKDCERHRGGWCSPDKNCWDCFHIDVDGSARVRFTNYTPREFCHPSNLTMQTFREQPWRVGEQFQSYQWHDGRSAEHLHHYALNICEGCYEQQDPDVWTGVSEQSYVMGNLGLMKAGDYFALLLVAGVVCMQASIERRDVHLCQFIPVRPEVGGEAWGPRVLFCLNSARQFGFLPLFVGCMTTVVIVGLSFFVCDRDAFKAVAMVFLLEVDNLVYLFIVSDATKKDMEEFAKPKMTDQEKALLEIGPTHTALMAVSILGTLVFIYQTEWAGHVSGLGVVFALLAAWASAAIEAQKRVKTGESTGQVVMNSVGGAIVGLMWLAFCLMMIALGNRLTDGRDDHPD